MRATHAMALLALATLWAPARADGPTRPGAAAPAAAPSLEEAARRIDEAIEADLAARGLEPSPSADDGAFLRRLHLDLSGRLPSEAEVRAFLTDPATDKRERAAARLLASEGWSRHTARLLSERWLETLDRGQAAFLGESFREWLEGALGAGQGLDAIAAEVLAAEGRTDRSPQLVYALDRGAADYQDLAGAAARQFLGVRLDCARCHDHPFEGYAQAEFHGLAAYFARLRVRPVPGRQGAFTVNEAPVGEHRFAAPDGPRREQAPRLPGPGRDLDVRPGAAPARATETSRRRDFARWVTSPDNPWFARNAVNRAWARLLGRGLVEPTDDLPLDGELRGPHAGVLDALAEGFVRSGFSLRWLHGAIVASRAYQRSSRGPNEASPGELERARARFGTAALRPLDAATLAEVLLQVARRDRPGPGEPAFLHARLRRALAADLAAAVPAAREGERPSADAVTVAEGLLLLNGERVNGLIGAAAARLLAGEGPDGSRLERLFLRALSRRPSGTERRALLGWLEERAAAVGEREAWADLVWAVVATTEATSNH